MNDGSAMFAASGLTVDRLTLTVQTQCRHERARVAWVADIDEVARAVEGQRPTRAIEGGRWTPPEQVDRMSQFRYDFIIHS
ncbi:MAG: hypothetical protein AAFX81_06340 [Pseudomonadota bacterium]